MGDYNNYNNGYDYSYAGQEYDQNWEEQQQENHGMFRSVTYNGMEFNVDEYGRVVDPDRLLPVHQIKGRTVFRNSAL